MEITDVYSKPRIVLKLLPGLMTLFIAGIVMVTEFGTTSNEGFIIAVAGFIWLDVNILMMKTDVLLEEMNNRK